VLLELSLDRPVVGRPVNIVATTEQITTAQIDNPQLADSAVTDDWCSPRPTHDPDPPDGVPQACGGTSFGNGGCLSSPGGAGFFDYSQTSFSGIIVEGDQRISFPVTIIDDCIDENDARFRVSLEVDGASLENPAAPHFDVIIEDNDPTPMVAFAVESALPENDACGQFPTSSGSSAGWRLGEDKRAAECAEAAVRLQLRYATDPADELFIRRPVLGLSGRPGSFVVESPGAPLGATTAAAGSGTNGDGDFELLPTMRVEIIDDEIPDGDDPPGDQSSIPWLSATPGTSVSRDTSTPPNYSIDRSTLSTLGIPINFEVARPPPPTPSVASQGVSDTQGLPINYQITVHFSDDPNTPGPADPGSLSPLSATANSIRPCDFSGTSNVLMPFAVQLQPFIDADVITSIDFRLVPGLSWPQPSHPMYRIDPAHSDFTVTVNSVP